MIRLRIWDKINKILSYEICEIDFSTRRLAYHFNEREDGCSLCREIDFEDAIISQYIGLKDKNGKEIYEGDVLKSEHETVIVDWRKSDASYIYRDLTKRRYIVTKKGLWQIIGNIYENPELVEEEKWN